MSITHLAMCTAMMTSNSSPASDVPPRARFGSQAWQAISPGGFPWVPRRPFAFPSFAARLTQEPGADRGAVPEDARDLQELASLRRTGRQQAGSGQESRSLAGGWNRVKGL